MNKYLLLAVASFLFVDSCIAMEVQNEKLISHKEWSSGKATGYFLENKINQSMYIKRKLKKTSPTDSTVVASIWSKVSDTPDGKVGDQIQINASNNVNIQNLNNVDQQYTIYTELCTYQKNVDEPIGCVHSEDVVLLKPQDFSIISKFPVLNVSYQQADTYDVWLITDVWAENTLFQDNQDNSIKIT